MVFLFEEINFLGLAFVTMLISIPFIKVRSLGPSLSDDPLDRSLTCSHPESPCQPSPQQTLTNIIIFLKSLSKIEWEIIFHPKPGQQRSWWIIVISSIGFVLSEEKELPDPATCSLTHISSVHFSCRCYRSSVYKNYFLNLKKYYIMLRSKVFKNEELYLILS